MKVQARHTRQKRLHTLSDDEIEALYGRPRFTPEERLEYFTLSPVEKAALEPFHSIKSRIYYNLQLGYFKARQMFLSSARARWPRTPGTSRNATFPMSYTRAWQ